MTAYYVLGITMVVGALVLSAIGLTREGFPPSRGVARAIIGGTLLLVLVGAAVLVVVTDKEHPKQEAAEKAELAAEKSTGENPEGAVQGQGARGSTKVRAVEKEFSIKLESGDSLKPSKYDFRVVNQGKIDHDLAIEGGGTEEKTALIGPGKEASLEADLKPGKYRFYCTVPGHAQSGMDVDVTVK
jgi:uncharacterized cupredoxin-like copper-binding protein